MDEREVELIPQPHGGALQRGNPGNRGGYGRPPNVAVRQADEDLKAMLDRLRAAARDERTPARDLVQIARLFVEIANRIEPEEVPASAVLRLTADEIHALERREAEQQREHLVDPPDAVIGEIGDAPAPRRPAPPASSAPLRTGPGRENIPGPLVVGP